MVIRLGRKRDQGKWMGSWGRGDTANLNRCPGKTSLRRWHLNKAMQKAGEWATGPSEGKMLQAGEMASAKTLRQEMLGMFQEQHRGQAGVAGADLRQGERRVIDEVREAREGGADCVGYVGHWRTSASAPRWGVLDSYKQGVPRFGLGLQVPLRPLC